MCLNKRLKMFTDDLIGTIEKWRRHILERSDPAVGPHVERKKCESLL